MIKITFCSLSFRSTLISSILVSFWFILLSFHLVPVYSGTILVYSVSFRCHSVLFQSHSALVWHIPVYSGIFCFICMCHSASFRCHSGSFRYIPVYSSIRIPFRSVPVFSNARNGPIKRPFILLVLKSRNDWCYSF